MSMTLEDAIARCEKIVKEAKKSYEVPVADGIMAEVGMELTKKGIEEYQQYAEWLKELQERRKQPIIRCKDCRHYHTDVWGGELGVGGIYGNIIVAHNACDKWTKDMNCVEPEGFCFLAERNE